MTDRACGRSPRSPTSPRAAGVSPATVSRVLNGRGRCPPSARRTGARGGGAPGLPPFGPARALRRQVTRVWAAIIADIENPFFTSMVRGIEDVARAEDTAWCCATPTRTSRRKRSYVDVVVAERMAGVVIAVASPADSSLRPLLDRRCRSWPSIAGRSRASRLGGRRQPARRRQATAHLLDARFVADRVHHRPAPGRHRQRAPRLAIATRTCSPACRSTALVRRADYKEEGGYRAARSLLESADAARRTVRRQRARWRSARCARCASSACACRTTSRSWASTTRRGRRSRRPQLTVVTQPAYEIGRARPSCSPPPSPAGPPGHIVCSPSLVVRESSSPSSLREESHDDRPATRHRLRGRRHRRGGRVLRRARIPRRSIASPPTKRSSGCVRPTTRSKPCPAADSPTRCSTLPDPTGRTEEPDLGQLLFPERRIEGLHETAMCRNGRRIAPRLLDVAADDIESWGHMIFKPPRAGGRDAVASRRGLLGRGPLVPRGRRVGAARRRRRRQRLPVVRARLPQGPGARASSPRQRPRRAHPRVADASTRQGRARAAAGRRRELPPSRARSTTPARTRPTHSGGRGPTSTRLAPVELDAAGRPAVGRRGPQGLVERTRASAHDRSVSGTRPFVDPPLDSRARHVREPDRRPRRRRHGARRAQGRAEPRLLEPGERVVLADIEGPGVDPPHLDDVPAGAARADAGAVARGLLRRRDEPSVSVPCLDFFGLPARAARSRTTRR